MLAGRKLLLADDSITIQKVVDLTFADEGVSVVCVNNGREAIERLQEFIPDVVLADVFMPQVNGYEVCEYIKHHDKLKHIPVMLLVGSFEPFDEEEARRVGANDILTKPFQSIRRLIEKVGLLTSSRPPEEQIPTAELRKPDVTEPEVEKLNTAEIEMTTADTQPLPAELRHVVEDAVSSQRKQEEKEVESKPAINDEMMETKGMETRNDVFENYEGGGEVLLDLGELDSSGPAPEDEFVLDIDLDEVPEPSPAEPAFQTSAFRNRDRYKVSPTTEPSTASTSWSLLTPISETQVATTDQLAPTEEFQRGAEESVAHDDVHAVAEQREAAVLPPSAGVSPEHLSPEMIDAIARRAVERLSEKVVQEIAWEVVPQLAELLIKRQLEEKSS